MAIKVTDSAFNKVNELIIAKNNPDLVFKIWVKGGGCSGLEYSYKLVPSKEIVEGDSIFERGLIRIIVDKEAKQFMADCIVDFIEGLMGYGFKFENFSVKGKCGCGNSFSIDSVTSEKVA